MYMVIFDFFFVVDFYFIWNRINEFFESWWIYSLNLLFFQYGVNFFNKNVVFVLQKFFIEINYVYLGVREGFNFKKKKREGKY